MFSIHNLPSCVIDENQGLAIAISLGSFGAWQSLEPKRNLKDYLEQKWLEDALPDKNLSEADRVALGDRIRQGGVWLLLDGLDEMQASSPVEALTRIEQEVRSGYLQKARVVLTCRVNVWDANLSNPLREFETYKTLDFAEEQRDDFIGQWFTKKGNLALGEGLITKLKESGRERICELVKNPLRLVLLCYIWTQQAGELPETKAQFYQRYLPYFYEWKKEVRDLTQDDDLQESLHQALAKLALAGIESDSRYRLPRKLARREMGQELFNLAVALGWLNIVDREQGTDEAVYAFFHPTFQEFFAACGVTDWDFFLPRDHVDRPVQGKVYRIFEEKWKEVILLWLGRGDVKDEEKEGFIESLVEFDGTRTPFYKDVAFFIAAECMTELKDCQSLNKIVDSLVDLSFGHSQNEDLSWTRSLPHIEKKAREILLYTERNQAINQLIELLKRPIVIRQKEFQRDVCKVLAKLDKSNSTLISILLYNTHFLSTGDPVMDRDYRAEFSWILSEVGKNNSEVIDNLAGLLEINNQTEHLDYRGDYSFFGNPYETIRETVYRRIAKSIEKIGFHDNQEINDKAIRILLNIIKNVKHSSVLYQAFEGLTILSQNNSFVINLLLELADKKDDKFSSIIGCLGAISQNNSKLIEILDDIISDGTSTDFEIRRAATILLKNNPQGALSSKAIGVLKNNYDNPVYFFKKLAEIYPLNEIEYYYQEAFKQVIDTLKSDQIITYENKSEFYSAIEFLGEFGQSIEEVNCLIDFINRQVDKAINDHENYKWFDQNILKTAIKNLGNIGLYPSNVIDLLFFIIKHDTELIVQSSVHSADSAIEVLIEIGKREPKILDNLFEFDFVNLQFYNIYGLCKNIESIDTHKNKVIDFLHKCLSNNSFKDYQKKDFVKALSLVESNNPAIIDLLIQLLSETSISYFRDEADDFIEIVRNILTSNNVNHIVSKIQHEYFAIIDYLSIVSRTQKYNRDEYTNFLARFRVCSGILFFIAQNLSYPEFYQAWHHSPITPHPEVLDTTAIGSTALTQTLNLQLLPDKLPAHCLYLNAQPLNAYTLPELSQELCNLIHQHLNQYPIPEANNLPNLKRHLLPLLAQHPQLTLIFGHAYPSDTLLTFCQQLKATLPIAWINDQTIPNLQTFSPQDPNLLEKILNWLNNAIGEQ